MNRIAELRKAKNISQSKLGKIIGVAQNTVCNWENGNREPDQHSLAKLAEYFNVSIDYLIGHISNTPGTQKPSGSILIPVLGKVAAGLPVFANEEILDYEEITPKMAASGEYFALQIRGDSMEPKISDGDVVIVRQQNDCETGDIVVVLINGDEATVKRIKKIPEGIMLVADNPNYGPWFYSNKEIETLPVTIIGRVVELRAKF